MPYARHYPLLAALLVSASVIALALGGFLLLLQLREDEAPSEAPPTLDAAFPPYAEDLRLALFPEPIPLSQTDLPSSTGSPYNFARPTSPVTLVYFGFTHCPDFCPNTLAKVSRVYDSLDETQQEKVTTLMVTVDPERDTMEHLSQYLAGFRDDFIGLRAATPGAQHDLTQQFGVTAVPRPVESALEYTVDHNTALYLLDGEGRVLGRYPYDTPADDIAHDLRLILNQEGA